MTQLLLYLLLFFMVACSSAQRSGEEKRLEQRAQRVEIIRDNWGIPHIYGVKDEDVVFGLMYTQCEESFEKVERAYIEKLGRLSELEGSAYLYQDIRMQLLYDTTQAIADYQRSPAWLKVLLQAFSDGIHYYLQKHPGVKPALLHRFEPWLPLLATDGAYLSVNTGGLEVADMKALFGKDLAANGREPVGKAQEPTGSNGFALSPSRTADGNALLYINPHVRFYFRTEVHLASEEGLNAYGAVTWGQFFVFQGFNEWGGWMHTSSAADAADLYEERIMEKEGGYFYQYNDSLRPARKRVLRLSYRQERSQVLRTLQTFATHHGPVLGSREGRWLSLRTVVHSLEGLLQSWQRMKTKGLKEFMSVMERRANATTNTLYADREGNIAYWHGNFIPIRRNTVDPSRPMSGVDATTEWQGVHRLQDLVHMINPPSGFLQNCNSSPLSVSGRNAVPAGRYPAYMAPEGENFRSIYALRRLEGATRFSMDSLVALGYDTYLSVFDTLLPHLFRHYDALPSSVNQKTVLKEVIDSLKQWDRRTSVASVAATVGVFWTYTILSLPYKPPAGIGDEVKATAWIARRATAGEHLDALASILQGLQQAYGSWKVPWGSLNRFQRVGGEGISADRESLPSGLGPAALGCLPSFETVWEGGKQYGMAGNSFVAVISFGERVRARAISTGGQSFDPSSPHFNDQSKLFLEGKPREVYFYREDVLRNKERRYHPGE